MQQATGYERSDLRPVIAAIQAEHTRAFAEINAFAVGEESDETADIDRYRMIRCKFSKRRFLGVLNIPPFEPHGGGYLPRCSATDQQLLMGSL